MTAENSSPNQTDCACGQQADRLTGRDWAAVALAALAVRLVQGLATQGIPPFEKYPALAWRLWTGAQSEPFSSSPVYVAWLAGLMGLGGFSLETLRWFNYGLGVLAALLVAGLAARYFGRRAGLAAGLLYGLCGPALVYESDLLTAALVVAVNFLALGALERGRDSGRICWWGLGGLLVGVGVGIRPNLLLALPGLSLYAFFAGRGWRPALAALLGTALALAPVAATNYRLAGEPILCTWTGGVVFFTSNNGTASGGYAPPASLAELENRMLRQGRSSVPPEHRLFKLLADRAAGRTLTYRELSAQYRQAGWAALAVDGGWDLRLLWSKLRLLTANTEYFDTGSLTRYHEQFKQRLFFLPGFGLLLVLAVLGLGLANRNEWRALLLPLNFAWPYVFTGLAFYADGRFRLPLAALLVLPAGLALARLTTKPAGGEHSPFAWLAGLAAAALAFLPADVVDWQKHVVRPAFTESMAGLAAVRAGEWTGAVTHLEKAVARRPLGSAEAWANLAQAYARQGHEDWAANAARRATGAWTVGELQKLRAAFTSEQAPEELAFTLAFGQAHWREGNHRMAEEYFRKALAAAPAHYGARFNLAVCALERGDHAAALADLDLALATGLQYELVSTRARELRAQCLERLGRTEEARAERGRAAGEREFDARAFAGLAEAPH